MTTTISAVILGIILVLIIRPGEGAARLFAEDTGKGFKVRKVLTQDTLMDLIRYVILFVFLMSRNAEYHKIKGQYYISVFCRYKRSSAEVSKSDVFVNFIINFKLKTFNMLTVRSVKCKVIKVSVKVLLFYWDLSISMYLKL